LGYSDKAELIGKSVTLLYEDKNELSSIKEKLKISGHLKNYEALRKCKNGNLINVIANKVGTFDEQGNIIEIKGYFYDITERKNAEIELIKAKERAELSKKRYKLLFNSTGTANSLFDANCNLLLQNDMSIAALGIDAIHNIGLTVFEIFGQKIGAEIFARMKRVLTSGISETFETEFETIDGVKWFRSIYQPVIEEDGEIKTIQVISQDITVLKKYEIELKKEKERAEQNELKFKNLVWDMKVGVLLQGPNAEILLSNPAAIELLGLTEDQLLGKTSLDPDWNVIHEDGSDFPGHTHPVPSAIATLQPVKGVVMGVYRPRIGERIWLLVDAIPELKEDGSILQVICTFINISERKKMEKELEESERQLKELNASKDRFFSIIAHDLKNPFNTLLGFSDLLVKNLRNYPIEKTEQLITIMQETSHKTYNLLEDLLLWSKSQSGKLPYEPQKIGVYKTCTEII
jgi:PAS domain S-box-containing protein